MSEKTDGGPAFPQYVLLDSEELEHLAEVRPGLSILDYFAGQALAGFAANPHYDSASAKVLASDAYKMARYMLAARAKRS